MNLGHEIRNQSAEYSIVKCEQWRIMAGVYITNLTGYKI